MGQVFLGRSAGGRLVAVKVIRPELADEPGFRARFAREVAAARNVSGLFTAALVDAEVSAPVPWLATAYVAGPSLADAVAAQGPLPPASVLSLAAGLAEGLAAIHAAGLVHRDVKPSNVLLASDGPRLIDFGISRAAESSALTQTGMVVGTPGFMSPEQAEGGVAGPASDVFSLGAVLAFAATGQGPFGPGSTPALIYRVVAHAPETAALPGQVRPLVERCLARDPRRRPTTADLLAELGGSQVAADWLPGPLTQVVSRYAPAGQPGTATPAGAGETAPATPFPAGDVVAPATVTVAQPQPRPVPTAGRPAQLTAHPGAAAGRLPRRGRRGRVAALLAAGLVAAVAAGVVVPRALSDAAAPPARRMTVTKSDPAGSARTAQQTGSVSGSGSPTSAPPTSAPTTPAPTMTAAPTPAPSGSPAPSPAASPTAPTGGAPTTGPAMSPAATPTPGGPGPASGG